VASAAAVCQGLLSSVMTVAFIIIIIISSSHCNLQHTDALEPFEATKLTFNVLITFISVITSASVLQKPANARELLNPGLASTSA
jgi:hypothetical protein